MCFLNKWLKLFKQEQEKPSPQDIVPEGNIRHDAGANLILISLGGLNIPLTKPAKVWIPPIPDTNSMDPSFDYGHNNILIAGADTFEQIKLVDFLKVGDIAVYRIPPDFNQPARIYAIHRIVEIGKDAKGRYFRFQGDNNYARDPHKARDENILWLCIGTVF